MDVVNMLVSSKKFVLLALVYLAVAAATNLSAATLTVTTTADTDDAVCDSQCSLREAIEVAAAGDTIIFARELRGGTIQLERTLQIKKRLTIDGPNKRRITIKGNSTFRIFHLVLTNAVGGRVVNLDGLIIRDGYEANGDGGGIYIEPSVATVNITNCAVLNNTAQHGGGIYMFGSGIFYLIDSTVAGNTATAQNGAGGIDDSRSTVRIMNSTVSGNRSTSTVEGTGGVRLYETETWFIIGSTITDNSSNGTTYYSAGGLAALGGRGPGPISNTIIAKNTGLNPDYYGVSSGAKHSLIGITNSSSGFINGVNGNIVGSVENPIDPQIGTLAENGGNFPTHALLSGSRAIDAGNNTLSINRQGQPLEIDQRGYQRIVNSMVDIGSYEFNSQPFVTTSTVTGQVITANGRGVAGARLILRSESGETRFVRTNPFGYYRFIDLKIGVAYSLECQKKGGNTLTEIFLTEEPFEYFNFRLI